MAASHTEQHFRELCARGGVDPGKVDPEETGTLSTGPEETRARARAAADLKLRIADHFVAGIEVGDPIGRGGHSIIRAARQLGLRREVAVKEPLESADKGDVEALSLLREAWVTGALEHPNVVPIYTLGQSSEGKPLLVMKRIEGRSWRALLADPSFVPPDGRDVLEYHLHVFMAVCNAVSFAHAKGILHRDVKPANVMVGQYGEVYVLDWGLAVTLREDAHPSIPRAKDIRDVAGTPVYLAPEMAEADGTRIGERTDVFLLGATLHQVVTGTRLHAGKDLAAVLASAVACPARTYPPRVPRELAEICSRATAKALPDRFPSAEALRRAVQGFLAHRSAAQLALEAQSELELVRELGKLAPTPEIEHRLYAAFSACRFGFQQALRGWPEHEEARAGLQAALESVARFELDRGAIEAARVLLRELPTPRPDLEAELEARAAIEEAELARLKGIEHALDTRVEAGLRGWHSLSVALFWGVTHLVLAWLHRNVLPMGLDDYRIALEVFGGLVIMMIVAQHRRLFANLANRHFTLGLVAAGGMHFASVLTGQLLGWTLVEGLVCGTLTFATVALMGALMLERWMAVGTLLALASIPALGAFSGWAYEIVGGVGLLAFMTLAVAFRRITPTVPAPPAAR